MHDGTNGADRGTVVAQSKKGASRYSPPFVSTRPCEKTFAHNVEAGAFFERSILEHECNE